jgi:HKD family nuclease
MKALLYENEVAECWRQEIERAESVSIATAMVTLNGLAEIREALKAHLNRGRPCQFLVGVDMASAPDALAELIGLAEKFPALSVSRFQSSAGRIFHPKFGVFHRGGKPARIILGSSNMTGRAFTRNCEANVLIDDPRTATALADYFEKLWIGAYAKKLDEEWLSGYRAVWRTRQAVEDRTEAVRKKVVAIGRKHAPVAGAPRRIKGHRFAFTGRITDWPRATRLYPEVLKLGGTIVTDADRLKGDDCLVHGDILGESDTSLKLRTARSVGAPIISVDNFFQIRDRERARRKRSRAKR